MIYSLVTSCHKKILYNGISAFKPFLWKGTSQTYYYSNLKRKYYSLNCFDF